MPLIRPLLPADLPAVLAIQAASYPATLHEDVTFFANRQRLAPDHCWIAATASGEARAYLIGYPWDDGLPPALGACVEGLPSATAVWFLHDCAVHPAAQGAGLGARLYRHARDRARAAGLRTGRLVSLAAAVRYWERQGYRRLEGDAALLAKLAAYGEGACLMQRALEGGDER